MRILHVVHQYPPEYVGGVELYTQALSKKLAERGHRVSIFTRRKAKELDYQDEGSVQIRTAWDGQPTPLHRSRATFGNKTLSRAFRRVLEQTSPDLVHIQHLMGLPIDIATQVQEAGIPYVITLHDYWWACVNAQLLTNYSQQICAGPKGYLNCARCALARIRRSGFWPAIPPLAVLMGWRGHLLHQTLNHAAALIAPTHFVRQWHISRGLPAEKITVIPHGIEPPKPKPSRSRAEDDHVRFVYIGGLAWQKGVHIVLKAFNRLTGPAELWIAGDEAADPGYVAQLKRQTRHPGVRFVGKLDRAAVWQALANADLALVPSLWYETSSLFAQEAFVMGVPVVASRLGALQERVRDGVDGLLAPPGDVAAWRVAMQRLSNDPDLRRQFQNNIRPVPTLVECLMQLEALYERTVQTGQQTMDHGQ